MPDNVYNTLRFGFLYRDDDEPRDPPNIRFVPLEKHDEDSLYEWLEENNSRNDVFLVYIRQRYRCKKDWEYLIDGCSLGSEESQIIWLNDWWEGQEEVEFLVVTYYDPVY